MHPMNAMKPKTLMINYNTILIIMQSQPTRHDNNTNDPAFVIDQKKSSMPPILR